MQRRTMLVSAAMLAVIVLVVMVYTVPGVASAVERWFGYVPGVGLVQEGQIRVLAEPVSVTREGVTVTVDQVVLNQERTALIYSVDGVPAAAWMTTPEEDFCPYAVSLMLPDGRPLLASPNGVQAWPSGYQHRFNYPPVPAAINDVKLVIPCLFHTRPGAAPENWEIPLRFVPAPPEMTAFPVIEIPTPTAPAETTAPTAGAAASTGEAAPTGYPFGEASGLSLTLDRAVQMDDGYLLYATLHWEDSPFALVDVVEPEETLHLLDANGQDLLYEVHYDEHTHVNVDQRQTIFAVKTAPVQNPGPLTLVLDSVSVDLPAQASFIFDPGGNPSPGQQWQPDLEVSIGEHSLRIKSITAHDHGYSFEMTSDTGIHNATLADFEHPIASGGGGGGGLGAVFSHSFYYAGALPKGPVTVTITSIGVQHAQRFEVQWTPPAASPALLPTQAAACLNAAAWQASLAQPATLPEGLPAKVLTYGPAGGEWEVAITDLSTGQRQPVAGATDGALSPDGTKLAYSTLEAGILITDLASGATVALPGTARGDFNPFWSPDSRQIVFNRGMGVFDLFLSDLDGANMRRITEDRGQEWPVGWLANGAQLLYTLPGRENEQTVYRLDLASGARQVFSEENIISVSPDGQYMLVLAKTFGERWQIYASQVDGANRWLLAGADLWTLTPLWSPDGQWLLAGVSAAEVESTSGALINLHTCQVIPLPALQGNFLSWVP